VLKRVFEFSFLSGGRKNEKMFVCSFVPSSFAKKKIFRARPFASKLLFFGHRISLFCRLHTASSLRTHYYVIIIVDIIIRRKRNKSRRKGLKRERERLWENIVRCPSSSSVSLFIITRKEEEHTEEEHIFEFAVKNLGIPPSVAST